MLEENFSTRLEKAMNIRDIKASELAELANVPKSAISQYLSGLFEPKQKTIFKLSKALNISEAWLMGLDVPMERLSDDLRKIGAIPLSEIETSSIPLLGTVKAGYDYLVQENIIDYIAFKVDGSDKENYYALNVIGDSMQPLFDDGDIVIVHKQDDFENGDNCVVIINGEEATVKKVYKGNTGIELKSINPYYPPRIFTNEEIKTTTVKVIGVVEKSIRNFKKKK